MSFNTKKATVDQLVVDGQGDVELVAVDGVSGRILTVNDQASSILFGIANTSAVDQFLVLSDGIEIPTKLYDESSLAGTTGQVLTRTSTGVSWSGPYTVTTQTTTYSVTVTSGTFIVLCNTTSGAFTVTLPTAVGNTGTLIIKKTAGSAALTVDGAGTETIDGGLTAVVNRVEESITLVSDNSNWLII